MSDSDREPALPLPDGPASSSTDSLSSPPVTVEQYLRRVRTEASRLPSTFVAPSVQHRAASTKNSMMARHRIVKYPPFLPPARRKWRASLTRFFASVQKAVVLAKKRKRFNSNVVMPTASDAVAMQRLLTDSEQGPLLSTVLRLDFLRMLCLLRVIDAQLGQLPAADVQQPTTDQKVASQLVHSFFTQRRDQWLFSLLTLVQPPLSRDIASVLRSILRKAAYARYGVSGPEDHRLARLNLLTTILAQHFGQHDAA
ncbi:unnamed protein product [Agarophyton chilense]